MKDSARPLAGERIGIFGKGGSGKSTVAVLLAQALRSVGYEVCLLDADSTNVGMWRALGLDSNPRSLIDHYGGMVFSGGSVTCPVDDPTRLPGSELDLEEVPSDLYGRTSDGIYLLTAGKMGHRGVGAGCDGPIAKVARDLRVLIAGKSPVTLVDFKAGFEDSARGVVTGLDWALVVVDPTRAAVQMAVHMRNMTDEIKAGAFPATKHLEDVRLIELANRISGEAHVKWTLCALNRVADATTEEYLREQLAEDGIEPIGVIHAAPEIAAAWLRGDSLEVASARVDATALVWQMEAAMAMHDEDTLVAKSLP